MTQSSLRIHQSSYRDPRGLGRGSAAQEELGEMRSLTPGWLGLSRRIQIEKRHAGRGQEFYMGSVGRLNQEIAESPGSIAIGVSGSATAEEGDDAVRWGRLVSERRRGPQLSAGETGERGGARCLASQAETRAGESWVAGGKKAGPRPGFQGGFPLFLFFFFSILFFQSLF